MNEHDLEVLEMVARQRPWEQGAWVNICYEYLLDLGYVRDVYGLPKITRNGLERLELEARKNDQLPD
jgi:hypothetical protein